MITTFIIGLGFGYYISPQYKETMLEKEDMMDLGKADKNVDLRYLKAMAQHHKGAILLADQIESKTQRQELNELANMIQEGEPKLIVELDGWRKDWYNDTSKIADPVVTNIGGVDEKTDLRFLNALIAHHKAGIEMTKEIKQKSSRSEVLNNAQVVEDFLTNSIETLEKYRSEWYKI